MRFVLSTVLMVLCFFSFAQTPEEIEICTALQTNQFYNDREAESALTRILDAAGLAKNFTLTPCENINNAVAISYKGVRYILYDKKFMQTITSYTSNWANIFILAHEVGHHLNGHSVDATLYKIVEAKTLEAKRKQELEADQFAAFILAKLGAPLNQLLNPIDLVASSGDDTYSTHPNKNRRIEAIRIGYARGRPSQSNATNKVGGSTLETYSSWQREEEKSANPFEKNFPEAYTFGEIKFAEQSNQGLKPKLIVRKANIRNSSSEVYLLDVEGLGSYDVNFDTYTSLEYGNYDNRTILSQKEYNPKIIYGDNTCFRSHKLWVDNKEVVINGVNYHKGNVIDSIVWKQINYEMLTKEIEFEKQFITTYYSLGSRFNVTFFLDIMIDDKAFKLYEVYNAKISYIEGKANIRSLSYIIDDKLVKEIKNGTTIYLKFNNGNVNEKIVLEDNGIELGAHDPIDVGFYTSKREPRLLTGYKKIDEGNIRYPYLIYEVGWGIKIPSDQYSQFSLKGSSRAITF